MSIDHLVAPGDTLESIAFAHGWFAGALWNDPVNADLRALRRDPNLLLAGDRVTIPGRRTKTVKVATGRSHCFVRKGVPARLRLQLSVRGRPRAGEPWVLTVAGREHRGITDGEGRIDVYVPPDAREGELRIGGRVHRLAVGHLDPLEALIGVKKYLANLGYPCGDDPDRIDPTTRSALLAFQRRQRLPETGEPDAATRERLRALHEGRE